MDMACAFLEFLIGDDIATQIRGIVELSKHDQWDDEFADYWHVDGCKSIARVVVANTDQYR